MPSSLKTHKQSKISNSKDFDSKLPPMTQPGAWQTPWLELIDRCAISTGLDPAWWTDEQKHVLLQGLCAWIDPVQAHKNQGHWEPLDQYLWHQVLLRQRIGVSNDLYEHVINSGVKDQKEAAALVVMGLFDTLTSKKITQMPKPDNIKPKEWEQKTIGWVSEVFCAYAIALIGNRLRGKVALMQQPQSPSTQQMLLSNGSAVLPGQWGVKECKKYQFEKSKGQRQLLKMPTFNALLLQSVDTCVRTAGQSGLIEHWCRQKVHMGKKSQSDERLKRLTQLANHWQEYVDMKQQHLLGFEDVMHLLTFHSARLHKVSGYGVDECALNALMWIDTSIQNALRSHGYDAVQSSYANVQCNVLASVDGRISTMARLAVNADARKVAQYLVDHHIDFSMEQPDGSGLEHSHAAIVDVVRFGRCTNVLSDLMQKQPQHHIELLLKSVHEFLLNPMKSNGSLQALLKVGSQDDEVLSGRFYWVSLLVLQTVKNNPQRAKLYDFFKQHYKHADALLEDLQEVKAYQKRAKKSKKKTALPSEPGGSDESLQSSTQGKMLLSVGARAQFEDLKQYMSVFEKAMQRLHKESQSDDLVTPNAKLWNAQTAKDPVCAAILEALELYESLEKCNPGTSMKPVSKAVRRI